jgi:putative ABC transport system substrate-binding protein
MGVKPTCRLNARASQFDPKQNSHAALFCGRLNLAFQQNQKKLGGNWEDVMRRRHFIALLGSAAAAWPVVARAQHARGPTRIGLLPFGSPSNAYDKSLVDAFRSGLREAGLIEDRDIVLDIAWTSGSDADTDKAVVELMRRGAEVLIPTGSTASVAAKRHTSTIPIVFISVGNPVAMGLVESLAHPGGNATGFSDVYSELSAKLVELDEGLNKQDTIDYLWHTAWPDGKNRFRATEQAAQSVGLKMRARGIAENTEIDRAIMAMKQDGATIIIVQPSPFTYRERARIIESASHNSVATIFGFPAAARDGALISYGPDYLTMNKRAPLYVHQIVKGTKPADLPVELPTKISLLVNIKTAKALGIDLPLQLLIRADELIE